MAKQKIPSKFAPVMAAVHNAYSNGNLFGRGGVSGGQSFADTKHDKLWQDFGYPEEVEFYYLWSMWRRNGLARAGVKIPVDICWMTHPTVREVSDKKDSKGNETTYEKAFSAFATKSKLWRRLRSVDICQRVGRYGALLMTVEDGKAKHQPLEMVDSSKIVRMQPLFEGQLEPSQIEENRNSPRYGLPVTYLYRENAIGNRNERTANDSGTIHHTRIITFAEDSMGNGLYGIPCNEAGFNALLNWEKIQGSNGEGFWRKAAQRFVLQASGGTEGQKFDADELSDLSDMVASMFAGFDAIPSLGNYEMKGLSTDTLPASQYPKEMVLDEYSASIQIPTKLLIGSQTGVKAADEDTAGFMRTMQSRRENDLCELVESIPAWLDEHTTDIKLPAAGIECVWDDLTSPSKEKKIGVVKDMAATNRDLASSGQAPIYTAEMMLEQAGFDIDEYELPDNEFKVEDVPNDNE